MPARPQLRPGSHPSADTALGYSGLEVSIVTKKLGLLLLGLLTFCAANASASSLLWSNGAVTGNTNRCDMNIADCGSNGWTVYDDFKITAPSTITGFTFNDFLAEGSWSDYSSTKWTLYYGDSTPWAGSPIASGTLAGALSSGDLGTELISLLGL